MTRIKLIFVMLFLMPNIIWSQQVKEYSKVKTRSGEVRIPGKWEQLNSADDSGQTYLKNKEGIVIAIAQNPMKSYEFFKSNKSNFENVTAFYKWDSEYRKENQFKVDKLKENAASEYIIWKYNDGKLDNMFLFGSSKDTFLNLLVYTNIWTESDRITFLEKLYNLNK